MGHPQPTRPEADGACLGVGIFSTTRAGSPRSPACFAQDDSAGVSASVYFDALRGAEGSRSSAVVRAVGTIRGVENGVQD